MEIVLSKNAIKQYTRLPKAEQSKIKKKLAQLEVSPFSGKKLAAELAGHRALRAWPYRIVYVVNKDENQIEISDIVHRQGAYK